MRARSWFRVHSFTGVITGLMLFVICWSGTFAVLAFEIDWLVTPDLRVEPQAQRASWGELLTVVERWRDDAVVERLEAPPFPASAASAIVTLPRQNFVRVYVDPYSAEVLGHDSFVNVQRFFRELHRRLLLADIGLYIVCIFSITMLVSLIAALSFYKRWWARFFRFRASSDRRALWSELHKLSGLWSLWFVLIIGLTGLWYLFEAARGDFGDGMLSYVGNAAYSIRAMPEATSDSALPERPLDDLVARARELRPELDIRGIDFGDGSVEFNGQAGHVLVRDRANQIHLDTRTGSVLYDQHAGGLPPYWRWSDTADPLHFGYFAGLTSKLIWFGFGLVLSGLILSGTWLHAHRLVRESAGRRQRHRWPGTLAASLLTVAVLAAGVPLGAYQARVGFGPTVDGVAQFPALAPGVIAFVLSWVAVTVAIIGLWVYLLWRPDAVVGAAKTQRRPSRHALEEA